MSEVEKDMALIVRPSALPSIAAMRSKLEEQAEMRTLLTGHIKKSMKEGHHFGTIPATGNPMLYQEGSRMLQTIFEVSAGMPDLQEEFTDDGHYRCRAIVPLVSRTTRETVCVGVGMCTTREARYAYRWVYDNKVPAGTDTTLYLEESGTKDGRKWTRYRLPNPALADLYHTIQQMALKRADTRATLKLPCVGELFSVAEEDPPTHDERRDDTLKVLRDWYREHKDEKARAAMVNLVFHVQDITNLQTLTTEALREGANLLGKCPIDWSGNDPAGALKAWQTEMVRENIAEIFGDKAIEEDIQTDPSEFKIEARSIPLSDFKPGE